MTEVHIRSFPTAVEFNEGRILARLVPYEAAAKVADLVPGQGVDVYQEGFRRGAFDRQLNTSEPGVLQRIQLTHEHGGDRLGPLVNLEERDDGLYGEFRVFPSRRDDVLMLSDIGVRGISVEFMERKNGTVEQGGVRWRTDVHLHGAALVSHGAYETAGAGVLAMRSMDEMIQEQAEADQAVVEAAAAAEALQLEAEEKLRELAEIEEFLVSARSKQAELAVQFLS